MRILLFLYLGIYSLGVSGTLKAESTESNASIVHSYIEQAPRHRKPGAAIALANDQINLAHASVQYSVDIDINSEYDNGNLHLSVSTSEGLYIVQGTPVTNMTLNKGKLTYPTNVIATKPGRYYVYINATVHSDTEISARSLTLIVQVGSEENS